MIPKRRSEDKSIIAQLGYPYQIFSSKASYEEVMDAYERAVLQGQKEGFTPILVPTTKPWELVAYVPFGGWNECPEVEKMMAVCKYWFEKYGAIPVTISHDVMEMRVSAPIAGQDSIQVAKEHFAFTPDRVFQDTDTGTLSELAACIASSEIWYFWWD